MLSASGRQEQKIFEYPTKNASYPIVLTMPKNLGDTREITDALKQNKSVLLNLEETNDESSRRLLDYFRGFICAINGNLEQMSQKLYILTPYGVQIEGSMSRDYTFNY